MHGHMNGKRKTAIKFQVHILYKKNVRYVAYCIQAATATRHCCKQNELEYPERD